jgi:cbb3-type cytochrome oxidase maturation protein
MWTLKNGQSDDDLEGAARRFLFEGQDEHDSSLLNLSNPAMYEY